MEKKKIKDLAKGEYFIAKAYLIDRVKDTRETVIERNIERTIY